MWVGIATGIIASLITSYVAEVVQLTIEIKKAKRKIICKMYYDCLAYTTLANPREYNKQIDIVTLKNSIEDILIFKFKILLTNSYVNKTVNSLIEYLNNYYIPILNSKTNQEIIIKANELLDILQKLI